MSRLRKAEKDGPGVVVGCVQYDVKKSVRCDDANNACESCIEM